MEAVLDPTPRVTNRRKPSSTIPARSLQRSHITPIIGNIGRAELPEGMRWIDVTNPNSRVVREVCKRFEITDSSLSIEMRESPIPGIFRKGSILFVTFPEFRISKEDPHVVEVVNITAMLKRGVLLTIHAKESSSIGWVKKERRADLAGTIEDFRTANHTLGRLIGSTLHNNAQIIHHLELEFQKVEARRERREIGHNILHDASQLEKSMRQMEGSLTHMNQILDGITETQNLFEAKQAKEAIPRYRGKVTAMLTSIDKISSDIKSLRSNWQLESQEHENKNASRQNTILALLGPPATFATIIQTAAALGQITPTAFYWGGVIASFAGGIGLVALLHHTPKFLKKLLERF